MRESERELSCIMFLLDNGDDLLDFHFSSCLGGKNEDNLFILFSFFLFFLFSASFVS